MTAAEEKLLVSRASFFADKRAFGRLVDCHQSSVRRLLRRLTSGDELLADDLSQEAFIKAWQSMGGFKLQSSFKTWIFRIAYNCFYDHTRADEKHRHDSLDAAVYKISSDIGDNFEINYDIYKALEKLNEIERNCITLFYIEEQKQDEIARITGIPLSTVKSHIRRGKEKLATFLKRN